jgi:hypothetical protein
MSVKVEPSSKAELEATLGAAFPLWKAIVRMVEGTCRPLDQVWKPSKAEFGRMYLLQCKQRTLLYLTPDLDRVWIAIVLGGRASPRAAHALHGIYGQLAMASGLPEVIKQLLLVAKPYAEGRGIRFSIRSAEELPTVARLVEIKTTLT